MTPPYESVPFQVIQYYIFLIDKTEKYPYTETIKGVADMALAVSAWSSVRFSGRGPAMRRSSETLLHFDAAGCRFFCTLLPTSKGETL